MKRGRKPRIWTKEEDALLGTMTDREAGNLIGVIPKNSPRCLDKYES